MTMSWRGFRYQTGEVKEIAQKLKENGLVEADADTDEELDELIKDLEKEGIYRVEGLPYDHSARDQVEEPEFYARIGFYTKPVKVDEIDKDKILYIDFFRIEEQEESYDEIFWG
ncbi:hypothetical protein [Petroclostridium xylanilyticum]|uniref:hypothetical protein n=1 Tax=Petroclostridium xylanilyticum TaxID=1792311 RepID=UPI000B998EF4|nr:hypothetical protein [Petroclostridium xylanilyticum]